jgi:hypothetical protein
MRKGVRRCQAHAPKRKKVPTGNGVEIGSFSGQEADSLSKNSQSDKDGEPWVLQ